MQSSERIISTVDGRKLFCRFWSPGKPRALLLIFHGIGEHGGRYQSLVEFLSHQGIAVMAPDQRGAGLSREGEGVLHYSDLIDDLPLIVKEGRILAGDLPIFLAGHSLGALTVLKFLSKFQPSGVRGLIFSSPALRSRIPWVRRLGVRILGLLARRVRLTFDAGSSRLSHDPLVVEAHRRDPLINHRFAAGFLRDVLRAISDVRRTVRTLPCPSLFLYAGDDRLVDPRATRTFIERLSGDKEGVCYEESYHEVFNEMNRKEVYAKTAAWIDRVLSQAPPENSHSQV